MIGPRRWLGGLLARYLSAPARGAVVGAPTSPERLAACLRKGDVLLVEGVSRISSAIKYITQSTWSHAALCVEAPGTDVDRFHRAVLVEADLNDGVRIVPLSEYTGVHTRVCRPVGLDEAEIERVCAFMLARVGYRYDLKNVFDLARYLIRNPPVPQSQRRRLFALGSGDPTKAICSSLIAQAFQSVRYPVLPYVDTSAEHGPLSAQAREVLHIRHHSLFAPRDFDISPYFRIIKPTLEVDFDPHALPWNE